MSSSIRSKARSIFRKLKREYPDAGIELSFTTPLELLIATILSAQCTDIKVNEVTAELFKRFSKPQDYTKRSTAELERIIKPTGFFRQKAKSIKATVKTILDSHNGEVPQTMDELIELPGVGRKTANVILGNAFNIPGLPVDTHVKRISNRLGLTKESDPVKIEFDLNQLIPEAEWTLFSHTLIHHGRKVCKARKPLCDKCPVTKWCDYFEQS
jgi:endonuclease-3